MNDKNEILEELWLARKEIEKENNNDVDKIFKKYEKKQKNNPSEYYQGKPVKIKKSKAA